MKSRMDNIPAEIENCSIYKVMELLQGKWIIWILFELSRHETMRFGELKKAIPCISNTMLASTLKDLEEKQLVERIQYNEIPPHVEYMATQKTKELQTVFQAMNEWGNKNLQ